MSTTATLCENDPFIENVVGFCGCSNTHQVKKEYIPLLHTDHTQLFRYTHI